MRVGDFLEWFAACALVRALYLIDGRAAALLTAAVCLVYFGQCYGTTRIKLPKLPRMHLIRWAHAKLTKLRAHE